MVTFASIALMKTSKCKVRSSVNLCEREELFSLTAIILLQVGGVPGTGLRKKVKLQTKSTSALGSAKSIVMAANSSENSTYASAITILKNFENNTVRSEE